MTKYKLIPSDDYAHNIKLKTKGNSLVAFITCDIF